MNDSCVMKNNKARTKTEIIKKFDPIEKEMKNSLTSTAYILRKKKRNV